MFLQVNYGTVVIQLINFAIFFAILNVVFLRPVGAAIKRRRQYIESVHHDYERYSAEAASLRRDAVARRGAARRDAENAVFAARARAQAEADVIARDHATHAAEIMDQAQQTIEGEFAVAKAREDELSQMLAKTLLARALGAPR